MIGEKLVPGGAVVADALTQGRITDLLVRYWGLGSPLADLEKEELLAALDLENKFLNGPIHQRALARLKDKGIE